MYVPPGHMLVNRQIDGMSASSLPPVTLAGLKTGSGSAKLAPRPVTTDRSVVLRVLVSMSPPDRNAGYGLYRPNTIMSARGAAARNALTIAATLAAMWA